MYPNSFMNELYKKTAIEVVTYSKEKQSAPLKSLSMLSPVSKLLTSMLMPFQSDALNEP